MNIRKLMIFCFFIFCTSTAFSNRIRCPTVEEIKRAQFNGWIPLYISNEELAASVDVQRFKEHVSDFQEGHWKKEYQENAHCFYRGTDSILNAVTFAHDAARPRGELQAPWQWIAVNRFALCYSSNPEDCWYTE